MYDRPPTHLIEWGPDDEHMYEVAAFIADAANQTAVFEAAMRWTTSDEAGVRAAGFDVLGELVVARSTEAAAVLAATTSETDPSEDVRWSLAAALCHVTGERVIDALCALASDKDSDVRFQAIASLPQACGDGPTPARVLTALLAGMTDPEAAIRDWATFGLGTQLKDDSRTIRDALAANLTDSTSQYEAVCGLGRRRDDRAIPYLREWLAEPDVSGSLVTELEEFADERLLPEVIDHRTRYAARPDADPDHVKDLADCIAVLTAFQPPATN